MDKWLPIFWILGLCIAFFAVLMVLDYLKAKRRKPDHKVG
jgi:hypothetical protein